VNDQQTKAPGWYADPKDDALIRYWDGRSWTDRRRKRPSWAGGPESPDGPAPLPLEVGSGRRRLYFCVAAVVSLAAAVLSAAFLTMRTEPLPPRTVEDVSFVAAAQAICDRTLPALRSARPQVGERRDLGTREQIAADVERTATTLEGVTRELRALPVAEGDRPEVVAWLDEWDRFTAIGHRYATALLEGNARRYTAVGAEGDAPLKAVFRFAKANSIPACTL
jgi:hypothetical protein